MDEGLFKWISSHCRCIKELRLEHVGLADITIESSSLKSFSIVAGGDKLKISGEKLEDMHIRWRTNSSGQSLNIVAPSLTYLEWIGNTINHQLGKLLHLEKGEICLVADHNSFGKVFEVFRSIRREKVIATTLEPFSFGSILNIFPVLVCNRANKFMYLTFRICIERTFTFMLQVLFEDQSKRSALFMV